MRCARAASAAWVGACLLAGMAPVGPVRAQSPVRIAQPAMPLGDALLMLARRTGRDILFNAQEVRGLRAPAVDAGSFDNALLQIATRTGLTIARLPGGAISLRRRRTALARPHRIVLARRVAPPPTAQPDIIVQGKPADILRDVSDAWATGDILPPDAVHRLPDRTVAEALARLSGVVTLSTSLEGAMGRIDHAGRAIGDFAAVRGLPSAYLETRIDGVDAPQSLPYSRGTQLGLLPASGGTTIALRRVLDARVAGEAVAGAIEIDHPSPFSARARSLRIYGQAALDDRALRLHQDPRSWGGGMEYGRQSDDGRFAVAIGVDVARDAFATVEQTYQAGNIAFAITDAAGRSAPGLDPARNLQLASLNAQATRGVSREGAATLGIGWKPDDRLTLTLRASWEHRAVRQDVYQISVQGGRGPDYFGTTTIGPDRVRTQSVRADAHYWFETNPERDDLGIAQLASEWRHGSVKIKGRVFAALGRTDRPDHVEISFWNPVATRLRGGATIGRRDGYPVLELDPGDAALVGAPLAFPIHNQGERQSGSSQDRRIGAEGSIRRDNDGGGVVRFVEIGADLMRSERDRSGVHDILQGTFPAGTSLGETGLVSGSIPRLLPGIYDFSVPIIEEDALRRATAHATVAAKSLDDINGDAASMRQRKVGGYLLIDGSAASIEWTLGVKAQRVQIDGRFWLVGNDGIAADGIAYGWTMIRRTYDALLPSVTAAWHPNANIAVHAALWLGQTRPPPYQLSGGGSAVTDSQGVMQVQIANPALRPVDATNLDLRVAWAPREDLFFSAAVFAKRLQHYLYDLGNYLGDPAVSGEGAVHIVQPHNGGTARIEGLEMQARLPLSILLAGLRGLTIGGDATVLHSAVRLDSPMLDGIERTQDAPTTNVTLRLGYARGPLSVDAALRFTGAYIQEYGLQAVSGATGLPIVGSAFDTWVRPSRQLDLGLARRIGTSTLRLTLRNLLDDFSYRTTLGRYSDAVPETIVGGRQFAVRFEHTF